MDFEAEAEWRELRGKLGETVGRGSQSPRGRGGLGSLKSLIAMLAVAVVGSSLVYTAHLRSELIRPHGALPYNLSAEQEVPDRSGSEDKTITLPRGSQLLTLGLVKDSEANFDFPFYQAKIQRLPDGEPVIVQDLLLNPY